MSQSFLNSGTLVILCIRVLLLRVVVCKRGGEVLDPVSNPGRRSFVLQVLKTECYDEFESQSGSEALVV
jgi:hypothetical protein